MAGTRHLLYTLALVIGLTVPLAAPAQAFPVSGVTGAPYEACARVFPDPHAFWPSPQPPPNQSPFAKGMENCRALDFMGWDETIAGLELLASDDMFGDFIDVYDLSDPDGPFAGVLDLDGGEGMSAGIPTEDLDRDPAPLYLVRVTDEEDTGTPIDQREHFAYTLSIHGIERAGVEGGVRAIEDLATWASCEKHGDDASPADCALENAGPDNPHPLLETQPDASITAGEALKRSVVYFTLANPDGWRRGDKQKAFFDPGESPGFFYQRYNGNGVDLNRDWPTQGFTFRPYTPWSEPETRSFGRVLQAIENDWNGGIDLHGQLFDRAFSFTLIGGAERAFDQDRRMLQFVQGAWEDAEERLAWNPIIKGNDEPEPCVWVGGTSPQESDDPNCDPSNRVYGVQYGTVWDTIGYTTTGSNDGWLGSPIGLNADAVGNEMSMSHLSNCGIGTCYLTEFEQLHVDGNKSLIYGMIHYSLTPENTDFDYEGRAAYLFNPERIQHLGSPATTASATFRDLPQQDPISLTINHTPTETVSDDIEVLGPEEGIYNGGMTAVVTWNNLSGVGLGSLNEIALERYRGEEEDPDPDTDEPDDWNEVNTYYNQSFIYLQGGAQLDANNPLPGRYRIRVTGDGASMFDVDITFSDEEAWPDPGQAPYDVSNMDFLADLRPFAGEDELVPVPFDQVLDGTADLSRFDTVVAIDDAILPGFVQPRPAIPAAETLEGTAIVPAPGAGERTPATSAFVPFELERDQGAIKIEVTSTAVVDPDLYLLVEDAEGNTTTVASGESGRTGLETLTYPDPAPGNYQLEIHNWAGSAGPADYTIAFEGAPAITNDSEFSIADRDTVAARLKAFVEQGGNLVLTDDSLRALEWLGFVPAESVRRTLVYAGHVQFSTDAGETTTYDDPLAADVDLPGAAEGPGHRHQVSEPVPTGYAILDESGGDLSTHPQWGVGAEQFEEAAGRNVGMLGAQVTLGELAHGDGVVRILGSIAPVPTEQYDHPFGLASHGVTYTGYNVFRNLLDWTNPNGTGPPLEPAAPAAPPPPPVEPEAAPLPTTGGGLIPLAALLALLGAGVFGLARRRVT
ncbi:MAG: hypothetical protein KY469_19380 [Actinobacteria bacterium]|nr:hypothetical protein [Actinomycetota bacterium]